MITPQQIQQDFQNKLISLYAKDIEGTSGLQQYNALGSVIRDYISKDWKLSKETFQKKQAKKVYYFSLEFLTGKYLRSNLIQLGILDACRQALEACHLSLEALEEYELEQGLGNGGLGRLAACFMDSLSSTSFPAVGMGIRYRYGLFKQKIVDGYQKELSDDWLQNENVWEVRRPDEAVTVKFGGNVNVWGENGKYKITYTNYEAVRAVPYDTPIPGYRNHHVNTLRLWKAEVIDDDTFDYPSFSRGEYGKSVEKKYATEFISYALYPDDSMENGKRLRIRQEYFFVSAGCQNILQKYKRMGLPLEELPHHVAIQINDTHPALAVAELMRLLMDEECMEWEPAWEITKQTCAYTNHTILSEALEKWDIRLIHQLLPRIYMIIEEIDRRFRLELSERLGDSHPDIPKLAIIGDGQVRMAHLAIVGGHSVNGVAWLHTEILKKQELNAFYKLYPDKFNNKTNGITHRRWLLSANPSLSDTITKHIGEEWIQNPLQLNRLLPLVQNEAICREFAQIKLQNKQRLAQWIADTQGISINPDALFEVQIKRLHAYKRQLLSILYCLVLYNELRENSDRSMVPKVFLYGAKAYPSYRFAKTTIKLIHAVAEKINNDLSIQQKLKVVFLENYNVSLAEKIIPAADISLQISTASKEASGTGNMKLMMNGAVTIATLDGANVEIHQQVGEENILLFGLSSDQVIHRSPSYDARKLIEQNPRLQQALEQLQNGFLHVPNNEFDEIFQDLIYSNDPYCVLQDFDAFYQAQERADMLYQDPKRWQAMSLVNIAQAGVFSSDYTIQRYAEEIWHTKPVTL